MTYPSALEDIAARDVGETSGCSSLRTSLKMFDFWHWMVLRYTPGTSHCKNMIRILSSINCTNHVFSVEDDYKEQTDGIS